MSEKKGKYKKKFSLPIFSFVVALFIVGMFLEFAKSSMEISKINSQEKLEESAEYISEFINHKVNEAAGTIKNLANIYSLLSDVNPEKAAKLNDEIMKDTDFQRIGYTDANGKSYTGDGAYLELSQRDYFKYAMEGKSGVTNVIKALTGEEDLVIIYEPVSHEGKVIGMVHGVYNTEDISKTLDIESFGGKGYFVIFQADGKIIMNTGKETSMLYGKDNLWSVLKNINYGKGKSYLELRQDVCEAKTGIISYSCETGERMAYYMPVGVNDWYILLAVPQEVISSYSTKVNYSATFMVMEIILALLVLGVFIIKNERGYQNIILNVNRDIKTITDAIPGGVQKCTYDEKCEFVYISQGFVNMTGYDREEIIERFDNRFINTVYFEDVDRVLKQLLAYKGEGYIDFEYRIQRKDGNIIWIADRCNLVKDDEGKQYFYCVLMDITTEKNARREQQISNKKFKIAMGHLSCTVFEYDPINNWIYNTEETVRKLKLPPVFTGGPKEVAERNIVDKEYEDVCMNMFKSICCGQHVASCVVSGHLDEKKHWYKITLSSILDEEKKPIWAVGTVENITKLKEIEQRFAKEEQYRELYMADAVFIHEVNVTRDEAKIIRIGANNKKSAIVSYSNICKRLIDKFVYPEQREMVSNMFSAKKLI